MDMIHFHLFVLNSKASETLRQEFYKLTFDKIISTVN